MMKKVRVRFNIILAVVCCLLVSWFIMDFLMFTEWYCNTWKYQLKNEIKAGNTESIRLYEDIYVKNNRDLFNDNFQIREYYTESDNIKGEKTENNDVVAPLLVKSTNKRSLGTFITTGYCPCSKCNGKWSGGITSTGVKARASHTIAVDPKVIPYGTHVIIDGIEYVAEDCGGAIKGNRIDIYFNSHQEALNWGRRKKEVFIIE